ncbi:unnamed protein product [Dicrocoelium dendriticum]|nr:unnamed protein product [Dicrocoelium dendriticum]
MEISSTPGKFFSDNDRVQCSDGYILEFIQSISQNDINNALFEETLSCFTVNGTVIGSYECNIEFGSWDLWNGDLLHINGSSNIISEGTRYAVTLDAYITKSCDTILQKLKEEISFKQSVILKESVLRKTVSGYEVHREITEDGVKTSEVFYYTVGCLADFHSEAANILLLRLLARKGFNGRFETRGLDAECFPCMISYTELDDLTLSVGGKEVTVFGIERNIHAVKGIPFSWQYYLLKDGHLILRLQVGSPITVKATELPRGQKEDEFLPEPEIQKTAFDWQDDMELYSRYLSRKEAIKADYLLYLRNNPLVKDMLADFLQAVLMHKPENVVEFAVEHFKSFASFDLPAH